MAKENYVDLYGVVTKIKIMVNTQGECISGRLNLITVRRSYATDELFLKGNVRWDIPCVFSRNPDFIRKHMMDINEGDFVRVKGTLCTKDNIIKRYICPHCGHENIKEDATLIYVDPIYLAKSDIPINNLFRSFMTMIKQRVGDGVVPAGETCIAERSAALQSAAFMEEELKKAEALPDADEWKNAIDTMRESMKDMRNYGNGLVNEGYDAEKGLQYLVRDYKALNNYLFDLLKNHDEISNQVKIMVTLCREPQYYEDEETKRKECQFLTASNRKRRIKEDDPNHTADYPWVKAYGPKAEEYSKVLHIGSSIYIDGAIQARDFMRPIFCENCGEHFEKEDHTIEIVPYSIEYLQNCDIPESTHMREE